MKSLERHTIKLARSVIALCIEHGLHITAAESMTGGLFISELTDIENASHVIDRSFIVYSDQAKSEILNVSRAVIKENSVYSLEVIREMVSGLDLVSNAEIKVAISGIAGPSTSFNKAIGSVYIGLEFHDKIYTYEKIFKGSRHNIRYQTVAFILQEIIDLI